MTSPSDACGPPLSDAVAQQIAEAPERRTANKLTIWCQQTVRGGPTLSKARSGHAAAAAADLVYVTGGATSNGSLTGDTVRSRVAAVRWTAPATRRDQYRVVQDANGAPQPFDELKPPPLKGSLLISTRRRNLRRRSTQADSMTSC